MVRENDNQRVLPRRCLAQIIDKTANALVQIVEGIIYLVVQHLGRHIPGLMTGQGKQCLHPMVTLLGFDVAQQRVEHDVVTYTPLTSLLFLAAEV